MSNRPKALFILRQNSLNRIYSKSAIRRIAELTDLAIEPFTEENWQEAIPLLKHVDYIFSSWGMPPLDENFLAHAPQLKHIFYGAGSIRGFYTEAAQQRGIGVSSAWRANAVPTAEFAHAQIILSLKQYFRSTRLIQQNRTWIKPATASGTFRSTVGIVSLGTIGRRVAAQIRDQNQLNVMAYDPFATEADARDLDLQLVSLDTLFKESDVISLHAPDLEETSGMITRELLSSMKPNATLINTARGQLIDESALVDVFRERTDLDALLDVTATEPDNEDSPLWDLPNVAISPHIAGSLNQECQRMGEYMVEELERLLSNAPLQHQISPELFVSMA